MSAAQEIQQLTEKFNEVRNTSERLKGKLEQAMADLEEMGYKTIEEAETALGELQKEVAQLSERIDTAVLDIRQSLEAMND